jgi:hypothetical protein
VRLGRRELIKGGVAALAAGLAVKPRDAKSAFATFQLNGSSAVATGWSQLPVGGGGFMRSFNVNPIDGTIIGKTDTAGAWIWNGTEWVTVFPPGSMPNSFFDTLNDYLPSYQGVYEIVSAPSNSSVVYMGFLNNLWKSTNKCQTWTATSLSVPVPSGFQNSFPGNTDYDCVTPRIAVDPQNTNIVYVATIGDGVQFSTDGGNTWAQISTSSIPSATAGWGYTIWFDTTSAVTGGVTQGIYISSYGNGLYHSTNGGSTWSLVSGSPTEIACSQMVGANYYCIAQPQGGLSLIANQFLAYVSGSWSTLVTSAGNIPAFAVDPNNVNRMIWVNESGSGISISFNAGSTWTTNSSYTIGGTIPWQEYNPGTGDAYVTPGHAFFDPRSSNQLAVSHGTGISTVPVPTSGGWPSGVLAYTLNQIGVENLVGNKVLCLPNNHGTVLRSDDFPILVANGTNYPPEYFPNGVAAFNNGFGVSVSDVDYAADLSGTIITQLGGNSIVSTNWGVSWSAMPNIPATGSGSCAASSATNWIYGEYSTGIWGTNNAGASWTSITISGITWANYTSFTLVADKVTSNTYYLYAATSSGPTGVLYTITYSGGTWSAVSTFTGAIGNGDTFQYPGWLRSVPGNAGHLVWSGFGINGGEAVQTGFTNFVWAFSSNGGASWTNMPVICSPLAFAFGPAASGHTYPSIYVIGYDIATQKVFGLYRCIDFNPSNPSAATFTLLGSSNYNFAPVGNLVQIGWLDADPTNYGKLVMSTLGQGYVQGHFP